MKFAILSDIHSNLEALTSVLNDIEGQGVSRLLCLGDVVGYNANPSECIDLLRSSGGLVLKGNHDAYTVADTIPASVNGRARQSLEWTRGQISDEQSAWLAALPMQRRVGNFEVVHASLHQPEDWNYVTNSIEAILHFHFQKTPLCFFGHIHSQIYFSDAERKTTRDFSEVELDPETQYLVNVGSVGQPRSDDKRAEYVIYDTASHVIEARKVEYDIDTACDKIRAAGLPEHNALRLQPPTEEEVVQPTAKAV